MTLTAPFRSLAAVASRLPFHLNETKKVNATFRHWRRDDDDEAKYHVDLWTYCFIRRYFLIKFTRDELYNNAADMDALIEQAYVKVEDHQASVSDTTRYASWVSVVCKHAYLNYRRNVPPVVSIDQDDGLHLQGDSLEALHDAAMVHEGLRHQAPAGVEIAYLRFIENASYQDIARRMDKPLPIVRSYVNKAMVKLRSAPVFLAYLGRN